MANPNVFAQFAQPVRSVVDYQNDYAKADALKNQNALQSLALQQQQSATAQSLDDRNALQRVAAQSGGTREGMIAGLRGSGRAALMAQADALEKSGADLATSQSVASKNNQETAKGAYDLHQSMVTHGLQSVLASSTPELAAQAAADGVQQGYWSMADAQKKIAAIPQDPAQYAQWRLQQLGALVSAKDQLEASKPVLGTTNTGGATAYVSRDPFTGAVTQNGAVTNTATPGEVLSNGLGYSRLDEEKRHNTVSEGLETTKAATAGTAGGKMTEDQGKATGWLVQAENAFGNMQSAMKSTPSAAKPGFPDVVAAVPGLGGIANSMRGADRQKFMQGSSSLSEALLRAATGAGVNKDEAAQKIQELTPVFGEDPATTEQKMAAIPLYIESLKVRAGPGAPKAAAVLAGKDAPASGGVPPDVQAILDKHLPKPKGK